MKKFAFIFILSMLSFSGMTQEKKFIKGFSGGMMLHSGYQFGGDAMTGCLKLTRCSTSSRSLLWILS